MWFIFPQLTQLGQRTTARRWGIALWQEALACWQHPLVGAQLREGNQFVVAADGKTVHKLFGFPDELQFQSSLTLRGQVAPHACG